MEIRDQLLYIVSSYKYAGLYALFIIDTLGVFLPSKTILTLSGILVQKGQISFAPLFLSAFSGSLTGFTISYTIGFRVGKPFFRRYGKCLRISHRNLERAERWFDRHGPAIIIIAYFTPGLRHVTPYLSGISGMSFPRTITFAGIGAALWITAFVNLGRFFGRGLDRIDQLPDSCRWEVLLAAALAVALVLSAGYFRTKNKKI
ncbi:MAG: DedA family protein [Peptococcaceae bacterium]|nr:DedA family protein [Peptococcaceae bacterium]